MIVRACCSIEQVGHRRPCRVAAQPRPRLPVGPPRGVPERFEYMPRHLAPKGCVRGWVAPRRSNIRIRVEDANCRVDMVEIDHQRTLLALDVLVTAGDLPALVDQSGDCVWDVRSKGDPGRSNSRSARIPKARSVRKEPPHELGSPMHRLGHPVLIWLKPDSTPRLVSLLPNAAGLPRHARARLKVRDQKAGAN
jgi:hypothetical protein